MTSTAALEKIYQILEKPFGKAKAREAVATCVELAIGRLQDDCLPISEQNISELLTQFADDYEFASQKKAV